jgi:hypothetical protein
LDSTAERCYRDEFRLDPEIRWGSKHILERDHQLATHGHIAAGTLTHISKIESERSPVRFILVSLLPGRGVCLTDVKDRLRGNRSTALRERKTGKQQRNE